MSDGSIFYACRDGHYVLKFVGEVRLTLCSTIDLHLESVLARREISDTLIDLTETTTIDSTSLGLIAKLAIKASELGMPRPTLISTNPDITRILYSMGFDQVFLLLDSVPTSGVDLEQVPFVQESEDQVRERIIGAHRVLIDLNEANRAAFKDLVATLENCS
ncbi:MAG: anti-anti-sigma factor [Oceanospirillaceae bacterium]|jgi:anti-anti-sigma factor|uniref:STAS domain-containing protein n=1 Tax=Marinobacterium litorale TaxID=404770 RepID=UPI00041F5EE1|nr:STAS domain-containing protein [Marinobacterium litorale]MBT00417.1 anti-anti-sigma factor [Oceanospirillaceae bacterium]